MAPDGQNFGLSNAYAVSEKSIAGCCIEIDWGSISEIEVAWRAGWACCSRSHGRRAATQSAERAGKCTLVRE